MRGEENNFSIKKTVKKTAPLSFGILLQIKKDILGEKYNLSLVFIGRVFSRKLNKRHRKKDFPANVLAFPLEKTSGEIFINLDTTKKEPVSFEMSHKNFVLYLFIHACLHLKGFRHGSRMKEREDKFMAKYSS